MLPPRQARLLHYYPPSGGGETEWCGWHTDHGSLTGAPRHTPSDQTIPFTQQFALTEHVSPILDIAGCPSLVRGTYLECQLGTDADSSAESMFASAGLTSAMFLRDGREVTNPDPAAGLYIRDRQQGVIQASIPADHLAFQMGEASQVLCLPSNSPFALTVSNDSSVLIITQCATLHLVSALCVQEKRLGLCLFVVNMKQICISQWNVRGFAPRIIHQFICTSPAICGC